MTTFQVHILASDRTFYQGECESLIVPVTDGQMGIQANHNNMIVAVMTGEMKFKIPGQEFQTAAVSEGIVKIEDNDVLVLIGSAERPEEIDAKRAERAEYEAKEALLQKKSIQEYQTAQANLARAINRLRVKRSAHSAMNI